VPFATDEQTVARAMAQPSLLLFKHSPRCGTSRRALAEVERFAAGGGAVPVLGIDVLRHGDLSRRVAEWLGVKHASPQAILVKDGVAVWSATHSAVQEAALRRAAAGDDL